MSTKTIVFADPAITLSRTNHHLTNPNHTHTATYRSVDWQRYPFALLGFRVPCPTPIIPVYFKKSNILTTAPSKSLPSSSSLHRIELKYLLPKCSSLDYILASSTIRKKETPPSLLLYNGNSRTTHHSLRTNDGALHNIHLKP